ncbi:MAG TPA: glycerophosphodiester phosphodiesterase [Candidatus Binatia bacterium]|nr:glycerophosphodiester phosphodiesterase [Candidatus Binatia bacterium]
MKWLLRVFGVLVVVMVVVYLTLAAMSQPRPDHPFFADRPDVLVIAHQGGERLWPSNTMYAFERAVAMGVDVLEMDVHSSVDGVLVVSHDETVDRLTDGSGTIKEMSFADLQALDAGYRWTDDDGATFPYRGAGAQIPALEEVFEAFPDMLMNIEIKQAEPPIVEPFCELIRRYDKQDQVLVGSFHAETMVDFRRTCSEVATSGTEPEIRPFFVLNTLFLGAVYRPPAEAFQVPEYSGNLHVVTRRFVEGAQRHNVDVHVWTVNETADMERMLDLGVDGIITDRPDRLMEVLGREMGDWRLEIGD